MEQTSCHRLVALLSLDIVMKYLNIMIVQVPIMSRFNSFEWFPFTCLENRMECIMHLSSRFELTTPGACAWTESLMPSAGLVRCHVSCCYSSHTAITNCLFTTNTVRSSGLLVVDRFSYHWALVMYSCYRLLIASSSPTQRRTRAFFSPHPFVAVWIDAAC